MLGRVFKDKSSVGKGTMEKRTFSSGQETAEAGQSGAALAQGRGASARHPLPVNLPPSSTQAGGAKCEGVSGQVRSDWV